MTAWHSPPSKIHWHFPALSPSSVITLPLKGLHGLFFLNTLMSAGFSSPHLRSPGVFIIQRACSSWNLEQPFHGSPPYLSELAHKNEEGHLLMRIHPPSHAELSVSTCPSIPPFHQIHRTIWHPQSCPASPPQRKFKYIWKTRRPKKNLEASSQRPHCPGGLIVSSSPAWDETDGSPACSFHSSCFLGSSLVDRILSCPAGGREWKRENVGGLHRLFTKVFQAESRFIEKASVFFQRFSASITFVDNGRCFLFLFWECGKCEKIPE